MPCSDCLIKLFCKRRQQCNASCFPHKLLSELKRNLNTPRAHHLQSWDYFSTHSPSLSTYFFPALRQTLYAGRVKVFAEASEIFSLSLANRRPREAHPSQSQKDGSRRVINLCCKEDEYLTHLPVWSNPTNLLLLTTFASAYMLWTDCGISVQEFH